MWVNVKDEVKEPHFVRLDLMSMNSAGYPKYGKQVYCPHFTKKGAR